MVYRIFRDGEEINAIVASEAFVASYCEKSGYTYELIPKPNEVVSLGDQPTEMEQLRADIDYIAAMTGVEL